MSNPTLSLPELPLQRAIVARLEEEFAGEVPVLDFVEENQACPFILIGDWEEIGPPDKDQEAPEVSVDLQVTSARMDASEAGDISNRIHEALTREPLEIEEGWYETDAVRETFQNRRVEFSDRAIYRVAILVMRYTLSRE